MSRHQVSMIAARDGGRCRHERDALEVGGLGGLDGIEVVGRGEEGFADDRVLEDEQQVRRVPPVVGDRRAGHLGPKLAPRCRAVAPGSVGIRRPEQRRDRLADRFVEREAVVAQLDERQHPQTGERILRRRLGKHRAEQRQRRTPDDRGGVQGFTGLRIEHAQVDLGQAFDDGLDGQGFRTDLGSAGERGRGEPQRQWVATSDAIDPFACRRVERLSREEGLGRGVRQILELDPAEQPAEGGGPTGHRRLPAGQDDPHPVAQQRDE
jgi:hypothetical protein